MTSIRHLQTTSKPVFTPYFSVVPALVLLALFWPFGSGGKKIHMTSAQEVPAAQGTIQAKTTDNGNMKLDIKVQNLAQPSALTPAQGTYVVWIQPPGHKPVNQGSLKVNGDLKGQIMTTTPFKSFKVFITAEKYAQVEQPDGPTVLTAQVAG